MNAARIGRPMRVAEEGERVMLGLRVSADLKNKLDAAARKSGRSQSQEAEMRLYESFRFEDMMTEMQTKDQNFIETMKEAVKVFASQLGATPEQIAAGSAQMELYLKEGIMFPPSKRRDEESAA